MRRHLAELLGLELLLELLDGRLIYLQHSRLGDRLLGAWRDQAI